MPELYPARSLWDQQRRAPEHVGLWLDRMLDAPITAASGEERNRARDQLQRDAVRALELRRPAVASYKSCYQRWRALLDLPPGDGMRRALVLEATSRILIHPATERTVTEGGVLLHHTYGVPYLPGSALKGVTRKALGGLEGTSDRRRFGPKGGSMEEWQALVDDLFGRGGQGEGNRAGMLGFLDALWIPEAPVGAGVEWSPLMVDVVTPHHPDWYTGSAHPPASDLDSPVPSHRLTLRPGARFLVVVEAPGDLGEAWLRWVTEKVLVEALAEDGLGGWTSTGYGRLAGSGRRGERR